MRRVGANQARLPRRWIRQEIAADVARWKSERSEAGDLQMREVLTHAAPLRQYSAHRRRDRRRARVEPELVVDAMHQVDGGGKQRPARRERREGKCLEVGCQLDVRRRPAEFSRFVIRLALMKHAAFSNGFPGRTHSRIDRLEAGAARPQLDEAAADHPQFGVRRQDAELRDAIPEHIVSRGEIGGIRIDGQRMQVHRLPRQRARRQAAEMPRRRHAAGVHVARFMLDLIPDAAHRPVMANGRS